MTFEFIDNTDSVRIKGDNKDHTYPKNSLRILTSPLNNKVVICSMEGLLIFEIDFVTDVIVPSQATKEDFINFLLFFFDSPDSLGDMLKSTYDADNDGIVDEAEAVAGITNPLEYYGTDSANSKGFFPLPSGLGDMTKSIYDTNNNNIVDDAERLGSQLPAHYLNTDNHTSGTINKVFTSAEQLKLSAITGTNTGDQTSIVGITGNRAQFNAALTGDDFLFVGDVTSNVPTSLFLGNITTTTLAISSDGSLDDVVIPSATTLTAGLMSSTDKVKLDTTLLPPGTALSDNVPVKLDTNNNTYQEGVYLISKGNPITDVKVIYYNQSGASFSIQLFDVTNNRVVAEALGVSSTTLTILTLALINPVLPGNSILLVRAKRDTAPSKFIYLKTILIA